ncbi:MAG: Hsp20/alpha crystallin family protein [Anaerolineaceae bacterium]|nr:Hsp20/alpha crystallin family protein [Anaerolineaceae bacterium]MCY4022418.1 Hsp20/alpha crystallin family protein [Anaerolineaceae bacterium]
MLVRQPFPFVRFARPLPHPGEEAPVQRLPVNAWTTEDSLHVTASVAGLRAEDVEITLDNDVLSIRGEVPAPAEDIDFVLQERFHGRFERRLTLNVPVDIAAAEASCEDGVLSLRLPKAEEVRPRRIAVSAGSAQ